MLKPLLKAAYFIEHGFDKIRWSYLREFNRIGQVDIHVYRGFGNLKQAYISGRLVENRNIKPARTQDTKLRNLVSMYKRFESFEIPNARIQAEFYGQRIETKTNDEGYFELSLPVPKDLDQNLVWHNVELVLLDKIGKNAGPVKSTGRILIPQIEAEYGVISDIDDTVLQTKATNFIRMMQKTFLYNSKTRLPFEGVAGFYRALHMGSKNVKVKNPMYYVSSSPWNLYDMLEDFFEIQKLPAGPFLLRNLGLNLDKLFKNSHLDHKLTQIEKIFQFTGELPFILIGDSGQHDPEIYLEVVKNHPGRILAVYIRDVSKEKRDQKVYSITDEMYRLGTEMIFVKDTEAAARHAIGQGFIPEEELEDVQIEKQKDLEAED